MTARAVHARVAPGRVHVEIAVVRAVAVAVQARARPARVAPARVRGRVNDNVLHRVHVPALVNYRRVVLSGRVVAILALEVRADRSGVVHVGLVLAARHGSPVTHV